MVEREGYIPIRDVSAVYRVARRTVEHWVRDNRLMTYRFPLDRITYVRREELEREMAREPAPKGNKGNWRQRDESRVPPKLR